MTRISLCFRQLRSSYEAIYAHCPIRRLHLPLAWIALFVALGGTFAFGQTTIPALAPIETVDYDSHGSFRVNGQPFFPILLYDAPTDPTTLAELREFGFNVLTCHAEASEQLPAQGFYAAIHARKPVDNRSGVLLAISSDSPALYLKQNLLQQVATANAKAATHAPGRPIMNAIGFWEDEPAGVYSGKLPSRAKYDDLVAAIDVSAPYLYPVPYQPVSSVGDAVARARVASGGKKPLLPILQLFAWKVDDRYPTPAELRCMTFLAMVEGATGIGYYSFSHVTGHPKTTIAAVQPELWKSVRGLNRDLATIGPRLIAGEGARGMSVESTDVKMKAIDDAEGVLIVLVNPTPNKQAAKLVWQSTHIVGRLTLHTGQSVEMSQGSATRALEPFGVEILRGSKPR